MAKTALKPSVRVAQVKPPKATAAMTTQVATFYTQNRICNDAGRAAKKARKELYGLMVNAGLEKFPYIIVKPDRKISLNVWIGCKSGTYLDPEILLKELGLANFLRACDVSKASLMELFPEIAARLIALAEKPCKADENVHIEEVK